MKVNKMITTLLLSAISLNSLSSISNSSTIDRYETFVGDNIFIKDNTQDKDADVYIEGNTLINIVESNSPVNLTVGPGEPYANVNVNLKHPLKANTTYTMYFDITKNAYDYAPFTSIVLGQGDYDAGNGLDIWSNRLYLGKDFQVSSESPYLGFYKATFTTSSRIEETSFPWVKFIGDHKPAYDTVIENVVIVEGETESIDYFDGIKSVGESQDGNHNLAVRANNKNLFLGFNHSGFKMRGVSDDRVLIREKNRLKFTTTGWNQGFYFDMYGGFKKGETLYMNHKDLPFDFVEETTADGKVFTYETDSLDQEFWTVKNNSTKIQFMFKNGAEHTTYDIKDFAVYKTQDSEYIENHFNTKEVSLKEPLRKLPDGTKDKIIKKDGKWYVERNIAQVTLNGTEIWQPYTSGSSQLLFGANLNSSRLGQNGVVAVASDKYSSYDSHNHWFLENKTGIALGASSNQIRVKDHRFSTASDFANHLKSNPMELIYPLRAPVYEPLNIGVELNLYNGDIHLSNNSSVPATMKVVIDRVINIAKEKTKIAEANPTIENISQARFWINQIDDSSIKDQLQNSVNDITGPSDIALIERKTVTSNADLYIKSKNTLSLSLDTNSVQFEDFSGIEDMKINNAVELAVSSSLPYQVKVILPTGITNADKSNILSTNILNIKSSLDSSYKTFTSIGDELILVDSQPAGSKNLHNIDIMLKGGLLSKADVYKTTIKFEVEQK